MHGLGVNKKEQFDLDWSGKLSDYVSAIAWSPAGDFFAASSAAGEILLRYSSGDLLTLQEPTEQSVDCLAFSHDGQFLASGGQDGKVKIWRAGELITTLENAPAWVDQLAWSPKTNQLAFSLGRYVRVWDAARNEIDIKLNFETSSVLGIDWRGDGQHLAIGGYQGVKIWNSQNWDTEPDILDIPSARKRDRLVARWQVSRLWQHGSHHQRSRVEKPRPLGDEWLSWESSPPLLVRSYEQTECPPVSFFQR